MGAVVNVTYVTAVPVVPEESMAPERIAFHILMRIIITVFSS